MKKIICWIFSIELLVQKVRLIKEYNPSIKSVLRNSFETV